VVVQQAPQPFSADDHDPVGVVAQVVGEFADAPVGEGPAQLLGPGLGDFHDERLVFGGDAAGTSARPVRLQRIQSVVVEGVDHIADGVGIGGHQTGDRGGGVARGRRQDDHRAADPDRAVLAAAHDPQQLTSFLLGQPTSAYRFGHRWLLAQSGQSLVNNPKPRSTHTTGERSRSAHYTYGSAAARS
jgi:hypothetical protein